MGANAFWNSLGSASAMTLTLAILPGRLAPPVLTVTLADLEAIEARERKPRYNEPMLADDLDHWLSLASSWSAANSFRAQSASCKAGGRNLPVEGAPLSAERRQSNERPVADGRFDPIGRDRFMACGMFRADDQV